MFFLQGVNGNGSLSGKTSIGADLGLSYLQVVVIAQDDEVLRRGKRLWRVQVRGLTSTADLNAVMRRIDLFCKLVAPLMISAIDAYSSILAVWIVLGQNILSAAVEYHAIAQVGRLPTEIDKETDWLGLSLRAESPKSHDRGRFNQPRGMRHGHSSQRRTTVAAKRG